MKITTLVATAALAVACSKNSEPAEPTAQTVQQGGTYQAPPDDETVFDEAFGAVAEGADDVQDAAGWTFEKAEDGAVTIGRTAEDVAGEIGDKAEDVGDKGEDVGEAAVDKAGDVAEGAASEGGEAALAASVQARLAAADDVDSTDIQIEVYGSEVTLKGHVESRAAASRAIRVVLNTRGVDRVVSRLTW
jgi:hypothetical protein